MHERFLVTALTSPNRRVYTIYRVSRANLDCWSFPHIEPKYVVLKYFYQIIPLKHGINRECFKILVSDLNHGLGA